MAQERLVEHGPRDGVRLDDEQVRAFGDDPLGERGGVEDPNGVLVDPGIEGHLGETTEGVQPLPRKGAVTSARCFVPTPHDRAGARRCHGLAIDNSC